MHQKGRTALALGGIFIAILLIFVELGFFIAVPQGGLLIDVLERADTVLVDSQTRPIFGPLEPGRVVDINGRRVTIGGPYNLGTGFLGLGVVLANEANFFRIFPTRRPETVNLGLVALKPGADPDQVPREL